MSAAPRFGASRLLPWFAEAFAALLAVWLALNGTAAWPLGLGAAALGAGLGAALVPGQASRLRPLATLRFAAFFMAQSMAGALDVARRALHPRMPIAPRIVDLPLRLPAGPARTLMVSAVSLVPGSLAADLDVKRNVLRVHLLASDGEPALRALESRIAAMFGLPQ